MIYRQHIKQCNQYAQTGPAELRRACLFVLATIQQQLEITPRIVAEFVDPDIGSMSRFAWDMKSAGIEWLQDNSAELYCDAMAARYKPAELLRVFLQVPGFGLVKAGFACQLFANKVGCIDVHNLKLYDIPLSAVKFNYKLLPATRAKKRAEYVALCKGLGGSALLWSAWCDYVAKQRPANWANGFEVSKFHVDAVTGLETGAIVDLFSDVEEKPRFAA